jgi:hypothetical protein
VVKEEDRRVLGKTKDESFVKLSLFDRWRPAVGRIAGRIAVAGGGDWGTDTIEVLDQNRRSVF